MKKKVVQGVEYWSSSKPEDSIILKAGGYILVALIAYWFASVLFK